MPYEQLLLLLLADGIARREASATDNRVREAGLELDMRIDPRSLVTILRRGRIQRIGPGSRIPATPRSPRVAP